MSLTKKIVSLKTEPFFYNDLKTEQFLYNVSVLFPILFNLNMHIDYCLVFVRQQPIRLHEKKVMNFKSGI